MVTPIQIRPNATFLTFTLQTVRGWDRGGYSYLYRVFPMVVNEGNSLVMLFDAINCDTHIVTTCVRLQEGNVVYGLPIPVVHLELLPICGKAGRKTQFIDFKSDPQE